MVAAADANGSTEFIRNYVAKQAPDSQIAIGTEINMVARLNNEHSNLEIECLDDNVCPCSTMYMIHPVYLLDVLERIIDGEEPNRITVPDEIQEGSLLALNRMLAITR